MASLGAAENARTSAAQQLANSTAELLRWLGVPAFAGPAAVWKSGRIMPLVWMLAFELGMVSRFSITSVKALAIAAPIIAFLAFLTQPISAGVLGRGSTGGARFLLPLLCVLPVVAFFVVRHTIVPLKESDSLWLWPHYWCDAMLTLVVLYVAMVILLPSAQASSGGRLYALWAILLFMAFANVTSVAIFPIEWTIGEVREHTSLLPLLVATLVLIAVLVLSRSPSQGDRTQSRSYTLTVSIAVVVLIFGLNNAFMVSSRIELCCLSRRVCCRRLRWHSRWRSAGRRVARSTMTLLPSGLSVFRTHRRTAALDLDPSISDHLSAARGIWRSASHALRPRISRTGCLRRAAGFQRQLPARRLGSRQLWPGSPGGVVLDGVLAQEVRHRSTHGARRAASADRGRLPCAHG